MYKAEVKGKGGIVARIVAKSCNAVNPSSVIATFELEYPRFVHAEAKTHRIISSDDDSVEIIIKNNCDLMSDKNLSRNAMSSRAVPVKKMIEQVRSNPATPIHWGANQAGMQAEKELDGYSLDRVQEEWLSSSINSSLTAQNMNSNGAHKQIVNRILEPYQMMKTVVTATELDNFFWLRCHTDAQPEIKELADCMYKAYQEAEAETLKDGEWHTPYVDHFRAGDGDAFLEYHVGNIAVTPEEALKVSASCCAQVSYRLLDNSIDKALKIYNQLVESKPVHASPFEHQAKPMDKADINNDVGLRPLLEQDGVTHLDKSGCLWSGNFKGWIQHRQLIPDNACWDYQE